MAKIDNRTIRVGYWNADGKNFNAKLSRFETHLKMLFEMEWITIKSLENIDTKLDLIVVSAYSMPEEGFQSWLRSFFGKLEKQAGIFVPCLIASDVAFKEIADIYHDAYQDNWYFDIIGNDQWDSLPIRISNLLRVHDHIHEIARYKITLDDLSFRLQTLEKEIKKMQSQGKGA